MHTYKRTNKPHNTVELLIKIPWKQVETAYATSFEKLRKDLEAEGFRKGKVPKDVAEKRIRRDDVYQDLMQAILPEIYSDIVQKEAIKPIVSPKIELVTAKENEDWELKMTTAEKPEIKLGDYKKKVQEAKKEAQKADIWVPGKDKEPTEADKERQRQAAFQAALDALLKEATVEVSEMIIEEDVNQRLSRLVDDVQRIGMTMEAYLKSKNTTQEQLMEQYKKEIVENYKLEFLLQEIADAEKITVEQSELDTVFSGIKDEKQRAAAQQNGYYYATLLRKQKVLDYLNSL
ncbi:MAG: trigger factor [Weeksellaceae bacterium]